MLVYSFLALLLLLLYYIAAGNTSTSSYATTFVVAVMGVILVAFGVGYLAGGLSVHCCYTARSRRNQDTQKESSQQGSDVERVVLVYEKIPLAVTQPPKEAVEGMNVAYEETTSVMKLQQNEGYETTPS
jgi:uncharacterized integral membrane protein